MCFVLSVGVVLCAESQPVSLRTTQVLFKALLSARRQEKNTKQPAVHTDTLESLLIVTHQHAVSALHAKHFPVQPNLKHCWLK